MVTEAAWALAGLGAAWWGGRAALHQAIVRALHAPRLAHDPPPQARRLDAGHVTALRLPGPRGRRLAAWLVTPQAPSKSSEPSLPVVLALHGWGANASTLWPVVPPLLSAGWAVLLLDARCHGESDADTFASLPRFAEDMAAGLSWLAAQPGVDVGRLALLGHSVGAAAALLLASRAARGQGGLPPGARVRVVVSLAAFAHPEEVMRRLLAERGVPWPWPGRAVLRHVERAIGERFDHIAPLRTIGAVPCPVLLVHGRDDATTPLADALRLRDAAPDAELLAVDGGHDLREALAPQADRVLAFLRRALAGAADVGCSASRSLPP